MDFRPHLLKWNPNPGGITIDPETVFPVDPIPGTTKEVPCRFRPVSPNEFRKPDGTMISKTGRIRVDIGSELPMVGQIITVIEGDIIHFQGPAVEVYRGGHLKGWRIDV